MDDEVEKGLIKAKELEQEEQLSKDDVLKIYKEGITGFERAKHLMKPSWFIKDTCKPPKKTAVRRKVYK